jgi:hypothetical protein
MDISSTLKTELPQGLALHTTLDGKLITTYVLTEVADLNVIAEIVPREKVDAGADIHANSVDSVELAQDQIDQVLENVNPGDVAVFLCANPAAYGATVALLGWKIRKNA